MPKKTPPPKDYMRNASKLAEQLEKALPSDARVYQFFEGVRLYVGEVKLIAKALRAYKAVR